MLKGTKREILDDESKVILPETVANHSALHDYADDNCYGGTEALLDRMHEAALGTEEGHTDAWNAFCEIVNPAMSAVDAWIRGSDIRGGLVERSN